MQLFNIIIIVIIIFITHIIIIIYNHHRAVVDLAPKMHTMTLSMFAFHHPYRFQPMQLIRPIVFLQIILDF
jgi:hypothetical protein